MKKIVFAFAAALLASAAVYFSVRTLEKSEEPVSESVPAVVATAARTETATQLNTSTTVSSATMAPQTSPAADFAMKLEATQANLPTLEKIRALPSEEKHSTPKVVLDASLEIGDVAAAIEKDPSLAPQGLEFYSKCAKRSEIATTVRAVCLSSLRGLAKQTGSQVDEQGVPDSVAKLVDKLND